ncbi:MAG: Hsp70 family protein, partial [Epsilonproteobacteria bacterium]|nr:Hsp70 family protein [Campylobacterota bacterium]
LGMFELTGIPPAPRGVPQIEVTFDIDANGILTVSAVDKATGKSQEIKITGSSGLSEEEIQRMIKEAEAHKAEDEARKALVETKNQADALAYQTKKSLSELGDKVDPALKADIEKKVAELEELVKNDNSTKEQIEAKMNELTTLAQKLAQAGAAAGGSGAQQSSSQKPSDDDVIDAEVE